MVKFYCEHCGYSFTPKDKAKTEPPRTCPYCNKPGTLIKEIGSHIFSELPNLTSYLSGNLKPSTFQNVYTVFGEYLTHANHYGGIGATIGFIGGSLLMYKLKKTLSSMFFVLPFFDKTEKEV